MQFYQTQHNYYCGIDLHARSMYLCIIDSKGSVKFHKDLKTSPDVLKTAIKPYLDGLVIAVECMFSWYWIADFCEDNNIVFILGHALYMKAIHGGKAKHNKGKALSILAHKLGRAIYFMLKRKQPFNMDKFLPV